MPQLKTGMRSSESLPRRRACFVGVVLVGALALAGCAEDPNNPGDDNAFVQEAEETMTSEDGADTGSSSGGGLIDVEGGYTQAEQMAELETVVEVMREHFGEDVATIDGEPWTAERHDAEVTPDPHGDDVYRHGVNFDVPADGDLEETYAAAEEIAEELGLSENLNNSNGITQYDKIFYGAGREEGRTFVIASTTDGTGYRASYDTRHSDHESIRDASERVRAKNREERDGEFGPDNPRQLEDIEGYDEDGEPAD